LIEDDYYEDNDDFIDVKLIEDEDDYYEEDSDDFLDVLYSWRWFIVPIAWIAVPICCIVKIILRCIRRKNIERA
jgi:hypothetical protein